MRERKQLAYEGTITVVVTLDEETGELRDEPHIVARGVRGLSANGFGNSGAPMNYLMTDAKRVVEASITGASRQTLADETLLKEHVRVELKRFIQKQTGSRPVIMPVIVMYRELCTGCFVPSACNFSDKEQYTAQSSTDEFLDRQDCHDNRRLFRDRKSLALEIASRGARLGLVARRQELLDEVVAAVQGRAVAVTADVRDADAMKAAADRIRGSLVRSMAYCECGHRNFDPHLATGSKPRR